MKHTVSCLCCGSTTASVYLGLYGEGQGPTGCKSWICNDCRNSSASPVDTLDGGPRLAWSTIAKADRLRAAGYGRTVNDVLQRGLLTLEHTAAGRK